MVEEALLAVEEALLAVEEALLLALLVALALVAKGTAAAGTLKLLEKAQAQVQVVLAAGAAGHSETAAGTVKLLAQ